MDNSKKTFMFIYENMEIGGIEAYLIRLIRKLKEEGNRIIWLTQINRKIDDGFEQDLIDGYVEIIDIKAKGIGWIDLSKITFTANEEVFAIAFDPINFLRIESLKDRYKNTRIDSIYWVPHFTGTDYFIEDFTIRPFRSIVYNIVARIIKDMEINNNIFYLNESHAKAYTDRYEYKINNLDEKLDKGLNKEIKPFDEDLALKRSSRDLFNIISVGRFDFPHKAYILGLIRVYGEMKDRHKNLKLTIIGYGKDREKVLEEIQKLSIEAQNDVNLVGKVAYDELHGYFEDANLNISVAGALVEGAITGLVSIPSRHYCEECEGYGYLPEAKQKITSSDPGIPIKELIEEVIEMDQQVYLDLSRKAYHTYATSGESKDILSIFDFKNKDPYMTISKKRVNFIKWYVIFIKVSIKMKSEIRKIVEKNIRRNK